MPFRMAQTSNSVAPVTVAIHASSTREQQGKIGVVLLFRELIIQKAAHATSSSKKYEEATSSEDEDFYP